MKKTAIAAVPLIAILMIVIFSGCAKKLDNKLEYEIMDDGTAEIVSYTDLTTATEIVIPDEIDGRPVVKVRDFGLFNAESLTKITIGKNISEIGSWAFTNNQNLSEFSVNPENQFFTAVDGVLFTKDMKTLVSYPPGRNIAFDKYKTALNTTSYQIPDGVATIRSKAFYKCYYVTDIKIPESVTTIEEKAFHRTSGLESIVLPQNLTFIGKDAFSYCGKLERITIPASVREIDEYAFYNCTNIKEVRMDGREDGMTLGKKWYPTDNGRELKGMTIQWNN